MQRENKPESLFKIKEEEDKPPSLQPEGQLTGLRPIPRYVVPRMIQPSRTPIRFAPTAMPRIVGPPTHRRPGYYNVIDGFNELATLRFLNGNGLPVEKVYDQHFSDFLGLLNPRRAPPTPSNMISRAQTTMRSPLNYERSCGPISVTIEAVRKVDEVFLTISVHFFDVNEERQNTVHFEKIILADYEGRIVADRIRRVVDPKKFGSPVVTNIISPNIRMVQLVSQSTQLKNTFICFFSYISNIAREVSNLEEFIEPLQSLRDYVDAIRNHREVYTKFKRIQHEARSQLPLPTLDVPGEWLSMLQFLATCGLLNETFEKIGETWCMPEYLTNTEQSAMSNLLRFLIVLCRISTEICDEDSCISQVLYAMSVINNAIENVEIRSAREKMRQIFGKYYTSISKPKDKKIGEVYSISALLDPRYGYRETIFTEDDWVNVEKKLCTFSQYPVRKVNEIMEELEGFKHLLLTSRPTFEAAGDSVFKWWNSKGHDFPELRKKWMELSGIPAVSVDGKRFFAKGGKLAHFFATLDESLNTRALIVAQSSQDFVGRGYQSHVIYERVKNQTGLFKMCEYENDLEDGEEEVEEVIYPDRVKIEPSESSDEPPEKKPKFMLVEPKLEPEEENEEKEEPTEREIKEEPVDS